MKKRRAIFSILLLLLLCLFTTYSYAAEEKGKTEESADALIEEFSKIIPEESGVSVEENELISGIGFDGMLRALLNAIEGERPEIVKFFFTVLGFAILSVAVSLSSYASSSIEKCAGVGVSVLSGAAIYPSLYSLFLTVGKSLESVSSFFGAALPVLTAITTASGSVKTAAVQAANMNVALGIVGALLVKLLLPLSLAMLAIALVSSFGDGGVASVGRGIKNLFTFGLGIVTAVSSAAVTLQTVIASASDSAALRAARYAASGLIPVVGSSVSSALSTLAGGFAYAKSTVGAAAIAVIVVLTMAPLVSLLLYRAVFSISISFLDYVGNGVTSRCFCAYRTAIDAAISIHVMSIIVCIMQVIVFMKGGASLS